MLGCLLEMKQANYAREETRVEIKDLEQARLLSDPESFRYFGPFLAKDCTVAGAAKELHCKVDTMLYRVRIFLKAGLLKVVRLEPRRGRPVKVYRSSTESYFVPLAVTPFEDTEARIKRQNDEATKIIARSIAKVLHELKREGRHIYRDSRGEVWLSSGSDASEMPADFDDIEAIKQSVYDKSKPVAALTDGEIDLSDQDARELTLELYQLWNRYKNKSNSKTQKKYLFQFALVPMDD